MSSTFDPTTVRSLSWRTDLIFPAFDGEVIDRGEYIVIRTPSNRHYYWGNFLLFREPPQEQDLQRWPHLFAREIGSPPATRHQTFGWDSPEGEFGMAERFTELGFRVEEAFGLTTDRITPPPPSSLPDIEIRPLTTSEEYAQAVENQIICHGHRFPEENYRAFSIHQMERYRAMVESERGSWFGAFLDGRLVADLGLFHDRAGTGRYQNVQTHPEARGRGIATRLVYEAGVYGEKKWDLDHLVIVCDPGTTAERIYRSLGFEGEEKQPGLEKW